MPNPYERAQTPFPSDLLIDTADLLSEKYATDLIHGESIQVESFQGSDCVLLKILVGTSKKAHVFEFFADFVKSANLEDGFGLLLDFADGVLEEFFAKKRNAGLPLNFAKRRFEAVDLLVRQDFHDFEAERLAEILLNSATNKKHSNLE